MKKIKKLALQKEELMNLNSPEMDSIKGGTLFTVVFLPTTKGPTYGGTIGGTYA